MVPRRLIRLESHAMGSGCLHAMIRQEVLLEANLESVELAYV